MAEFDRVVERFGPLGWRVDLCLEAKALDGFRPKLRKLPVRYMIDRMGLVDAAQGLDQPDFVALLGLLATDEKCWVRITDPERISATGAPVRDAVPFAQKLIATAPDRVIWGTDGPHPKVNVMPCDRDLVDLVPIYASDPALQRKLLVENPGRRSGSRHENARVPRRAAAAMTATPPIARAGAGHRRWYVQLWVPVLAAMQPFGDAFIEAIRMLIAPIIFCAVVHGIASMVDMAKAGRVTIKALVHFEVMTTIALINGDTGEVAAVAAP
jgi:hypothetical protein